jgi:hypothetical protein
MIIFIVVIFWLALAEVPSQLTLVAVGIFIRMAYMDFAFPKLPKSIYLVWIMIGVLTYALGEQTADQAIMLFLKVSLSGMLILHMTKRAGSSPISRLPYIGQVWLFSKRAGVILPKKIDEIKMSTDQKISWLRRTLASQPALFRV